MIRAEFRPSIASKIEVDENSECWLWTGDRTPDGYGRFNHKLAHRVTFELLRGPIPQGLQIDHLCRVRNCVNPDHMEPVDSRTNTLRGISPSAANAQRTECVHGHEFTPENTYIRRRRNGRTYRGCWTCIRTQRAAYDAARRAS